MYFSTHTPDRSKRIPHGIIWSLAQLVTLRVLGVILSHTPPYFCMGGSAALGSAPADAAGARDRIGGKGPVWELWGAARTRVSTGSAAGGDTTPECVISGPNRQVRGAAGLRNVNWL